MPLRESQWCVHCTAPPNSSLADAHLRMQANRRYTYFAQQADVQGYPDVAAVFRSTAEGETGHALGHMEFIQVTVRTLALRRGHTGGNASRSTLCRPL